MVPHDIQEASQHQHKKAPPPKPRSDERPCENVLYARSCDEAVKIYKAYGAVEISTPATDEFMQFATTLYMKMLNMCPVQEKGNRGELRHCVNAPGNVNDDAFYNLFSYIMEPGRILYNLLKAIEPTLKLEKLGGDVVLPGAPNSDATKWHRDWELSNLIVAVSVFIHPITVVDAPLWIATPDKQVCCVGQPGRLLVRDVATWHRGSDHLGVTARALPTYRFTSAKARREHKLNPVRTRTKWNWAPWLREFVHERNAPSDTASFQKALGLDEQDETQQPYG